MSWEFGTLATDLHIGLHKSPMEREMLRDADVNRIHINAVRRCDAVAETSSMTATCSGTKTRSVTALTLRARPTSRSLKELFCWRHQTAKIILSNELPVGRMRDTGIPQTCKNCFVVFVAPTNEGLSSRPIVYPNTTMSGWAIGCEL